jgi:hypothetical protein
VAHKQRFFRCPRLVDACGLIGEKERERGRGKSGVKSKILQVQKHEVEKREAQKHKVFHCCHFLRKRSNNNNNKAVLVAARQVDECLIEILTRLPPIRPKDCVVMVAGTALLFLFANEPSSSR